MGFPLLAVSPAARSGGFSSISCAGFLRMRARPRAERFDHLPSKARRAATTALSMSALSPSATSARVAPVAGLGVVKVLPDSASTHLPSMKSWSLRGVSDADFADDIRFSPLPDESLGVCQVCWNVFRLKRAPTLHPPWAGGKKQQTVDSSR